MKKFVAIVLSALMVCALFANGTEETASAGFKPTKDVSHQRKTYLGSAQVSQAEVLTSSQPRSRMQ